MHIRSGTRGVRCDHPVKTRTPRVAGRAAQGTFTAAGLEAVTSHNATVMNQHVHCDAFAITFMKICGSLNRASRA
jgi:hypothetical protein